MRPSLSRDEKRRLCDGNGLKWFRVVDVVPEAEGGRHWVVFESVWFEVLWALTFGPRHNYPTEENDPFRVELTSGRYIRVEERKEA